MNARTLLLAALIGGLWPLLAPAAARAQVPGADAIGEKLFPPELIMSHQQELGIDDRQRAAIIKEMQALQSRAVEIKWQMQAAVGELVELLDAPRIDEARALAQSDKVMGLEREMKRAHLAALVRIRNLLTDAQRAQAAALRAKAQPRP